MALDLSNKQWPVHPSKNPEFDLSSSHVKNIEKYHHRSFTQEGAMVAMPLAFVVAVMDGCVRPVHQQRTVSAAVE